MERMLDWKEVSDGKLYGPNDLVRVECDECRGCSDCCRGMGDSIVLDPLDMYRLEQGLGAGFEALMERCIGLRVVDGIILPHLKMEEQRDCCLFLDADGRCSIHGFRPGFCRIFPLGRLYENGGFRYFLQVNECSKKNRSKVKVKKWIDTPEQGKNERFINDWHYFLKGLQEQALAGAAEEWLRRVSMYVLRQFYLAPYAGEQDFYGQFAERLSAAREALATGSF